MSLASDANLQAVILFSLAGLVIVCTLMWLTGSGPDMWAFPAE